MSEPNLVLINGAMVDINDPCALYRALFAYRMKLATGSAVEEFEIQSPLTRRRTKFSAGSKAADLDDLMATAKAQCEALNGATQPRRTRFAIRGGFRAY